MTDTLTIRAALAELVACKDLKERLERDGKRPVREIDMAARELDTDDYYRRMPLAWEAARLALTAGSAALAATEPAEPPDEQEREEEDQLRQRMSDLLTGVANALQGEPPLLTRWSWHDLPERATAATALLRSARAIAQRQGAGTAWERFDASIGALGIGSVTARTYRVLPSDEPAATVMPAAQPLPPILSPDELPAERSAAFLDWWHNKGRNVSTDCISAEKGFEAGLRAALRPPLEYEVACRRCGGTGDASLRVAVESLGWWTETNGEKRVSLSEVLALVDLHASRPRSSADWRWTLVPAEPTELMLVAGLDNGHPARKGTYAWMRKTWAAMLVAAPKAESAPPEQPAGERSSADWRRLTGLWRYGVAVCPPTCTDFYNWLGILDAAIDERTSRVPPEQQREHKGLS